MKMVEYIQFLILMILTSLVGWFGSCALAGPDVAQEGLEVFLACVGKTICTLMPL